MFLCTVCDVKSYGFKWHEVDFLVTVPPKIDYVAPSTRVDVSKGSSIKLECRATGNPPPKIYWTRKVNTHFIYRMMTFVVFDLVDSIRSYC